MIFYEGIIKNIYIRLLYKMTTDVESSRYRQENDWQWTNTVGMHYTNMHFEAQYVRYLIFWLRGHSYLDVLKIKIL